MGGIELVVPRGIALARITPRIKVPELDAEHRGLQRIQARVHADFLVEILWLHAVVAQALHAGSVNIGIGGHDAAIAKSTKVLRWEEAVGANIANASNAAAVHIFGTDGLRAVFNHRQVPRLGDRHDAVGRCLPNSYR